MKNWFAEYGREMFFSLSLSFCSPTHVSPLLFQWWVTSRGNTEILMSLHAERTAGYMFLLLIMSVFHDLLHTSITVLLIILMTQIIPMLILNLEACSSSNLRLPLSCHLPMLHLCYHCSFSVFHNSHITLDLPAPPVPALRWSSWAVCLDMTSNMPPACCPAEPCPPWQSA